MIASAAPVVLRGPTIYAVLTPKRFWRKASRRTTPIGAVLLDQGVIAGVGNVSPGRPLRPSRTPVFSLSAR